MAFASPASAAEQTFVVTSTADDGGGVLLTLREAVDAANANPGFEDTITFDATLAGQTLQLDDQLLITEGLAITGLGSEALAIERAGALEFDFFAFAPATADQSFSISGIAIEGDGVKTGSGIAVTNFIQPSDDVTVSDVTFTSLISASGGPGLVATEVSGDLTIEFSVFDSNSTTDSGGALRLDAVGGDIAIGSSTFVDNLASGSGGAIEITDHNGSLLVFDSVFDSNQAGVDGGGAVAIDTVSDSGGFVETSFVSNATEGQGGAVHVGTIADASFGTQGSTFQTNVADGNGQSEIAGGAIFVDTVQGFLVSFDSTFSNNQIDPLDEIERYGRSIGVGSLSGAALYMNSTFDELASTASNPVAEFALAVQNAGADSEIQIAHSTISGPGGLLIGSNAGSVEVTHTLVDALGEADAISIATLPSNPVAVDWSVLSSPLVATNVADGGNNAFGVANFGLEALADNGGPTPTRVPAIESPAREAGNPAIVDEPLFDQRGEGFPRILGIIDIGAVETASAPVVPAGPTLPATGAVVNMALPIGGGILLVLGISAIVFAQLRKRKLATALHAEEPEATEA